ncbi:ABC transporter ATP-binding protein [Pelagibacterium nitratireducens]|uniref:ABC transporter ATP-binding protein n=1 Tax=Pelagibacterium nitratireducens TaxID=1046114 RepID=A0ABZ2HZX4_9HYPH
MLSLAGAVAEMATLGAVVPFLSVLSGSEQVGQCDLLPGICELTPSQISVGFAAVITTAMAVRLLLLWVSTRFAYALGADLAREVYRRTLFQPYRFHVERNSSQIIAAINKVNQLIGSVIVPLIQGVVSLVIVIAILIALLGFAAQSALIAVASISVFYFSISAITRQILRRNSRIVANTEVERVRILQEGLGGIRDILLEGSQKLYMRRFSRVTIEQRQAQAANLFVRNVPRYLIEAVGMLVLVALAWWIQQRQGLAVALPTLGALALGAQRMLPQLQLIYFAWSSLNANKAIIEDVMELLALPLPEENIVAAPSAPMAGPFDGPIIEVNDVHFHYEGGGAPVLHSVNLSIARGARIGFIGKTGSGKSTLIDLIMGLLDPTSGNMTVCGQRLTAQNRRAWQARIAHVPQSIYLADASLAENIAFGAEKADIDHARVAEAVERAQLTAFIESLPDRYATLVGERGVRLSGGQRQRIGLARAFYKQSDILILDEATSALDDATEGAVMLGIETIGPETTVLVIAHRLTTLRSCDLVVELDKGRIVRSGTYQQIVGT